MPSSLDLNRISKLHTNLAAAQRRTTLVLSRQACKIADSSKPDPKVLCNFLITNASLDVINDQIKNTQARISSALNGH